MQAVGSIGTIRGCAPRCVVRWAAVGVPAWRFPASSSRNDIRRGVGSGPLRCRRASGNPLRTSPSGYSTFVNARSPSGIVAPASCSNSRRKALADASSVAFDRAFGSCELTEAPRQGELSPHLRRRVRRAGSRKRRKSARSPTDLEHESINDFEYLVFSMISARWTCSPQPAVRNRSKPESGVPPDRWVF